MRSRTRESIIELKAIRARAEMALTHAAEAVLRANAALNVAAEHLFRSREYVTGQRRL
jgi:hypothetical protein